MTFLILAFLAQGWNISMNAGLNLSQSYYNAAWSGDEMGSIVWTGTVDLEAKRMIQTRFLFINTTHLAYGETYSQDPETGRWNPPQKSMDRIENETVIRMTRHWFVDPFFSLLARSQFADEATSTRFNPWEITTSLGLVKTLYQSEQDEINLRAGIAMKTTLDRRHLMDTAQEGGLETVLQIKKSLTQNVQYQGKFTLFKALARSQSVSSTTWQSPDVNFQNTFRIALTKYLQLTFYLELLYDRDIVDRLQLKENLSIGLFYQIPRGEGSEQP